MTTPLALDDVVAIDIHTHVETSAVTGCGALSPELEEAANEYFGVENRVRPTATEMADYYRERKMMAVVFTVDSSTTMGVPPVPMAEIAQAAADNPDVLIPFGSVDPHLGKQAVNEVHRVVSEYGVKGFKFHPNIQAFFPNDPAVYPVYEAIAEHDAIALFHTGQTGIGAGAPGGGGIRLKYSNPMFVDDVAADFPSMPIILAHPSFPWQDEALSVATHKPQVYIDLSGWSPKYFPPNLVRYANTLLQDRVLFGSDFPVITPDRWMRDFDTLDIKPEVRPKILKDNAVRLLGLARELIIVRNQGVGSWLARRLRLAPDNVAVVHDDNRFTYAQLAERSWRLADALRSMGVAPGDRVAYLGPNHPSLYETLFAATAAAAIFVPLNWRLTAAELSYMIADCGAPVLVHAAEFDEVARDLVASVPALRECVAVGSQYERLLAAGGPAWVDIEMALDEPAFILYTSGTTGRPKGVTLSHANITWNCVNVMIDTGLSADAVSLVCAPLFHSAALDMVSMPAIMTGGTIVLMGQFDPGTVFQLIERHGVSLMFGVPAMFNAMAQHASWPTADLSSLRYVLCGGAPVPLPVIETYHARGILLLQGYGLTETAPGALFLGAERALDKAGTAGVSSFFTDVRVVRPDGGDVAPGERGEVVISGPNVMLGYWGLPDATEAAIDDGWFHSGDVAVVDGQGYVTIVDRLKDMIISGGENISPAEIESVLYSHPSVADCAVIGVPDERWGEVGRAVVVLRPETAASETELLEYLSLSLARYKVPKSVIFTDALPRSGAGKVLKLEVRRRFGPQPKS